MRDDHSPTAARFGAGRGAEGARGASLVCLPRTHEPRVGARVIGLGLQLGRRASPRASQVRNP